MHVTDTSQKSDFLIGHRPTWLPKSYTHMAIQVLWARDPTQVSNNLNRNSYL